MSDLVEIERPADGVTHLILNRPEKLNALSLALLSRLVACLRAANDDPSVGCVVLSGRGRAFSAGADIADQHVHGEKVVFDPGRLSQHVPAAPFLVPVADVAILVGSAAEKSSQMFTNAVFVMSVVSMMSMSHMFLQMQFRYIE